MSTGNGGFQKITDYYALKTSYLFDPKREREHRMFMAPRMITENESLETHLSKFQGDLMADLTPKRIYSGDPGNGKTHLLLHVSEKLTSNDFEFKHVECPALGKTVKPLVLFTELLNRLGGKNAVIDLIIDAYKKCRKDAINEQPEQYADESEKTLSPYLDKVFLGNTDLTELTKLAVDNDESKRAGLWIWLSGGKGDPSITAVNLKEDGAALVRTFKALFSIYEKSTGKKLLVIFDELDKGRILGAEAQEAWKELFRQICDSSQKNAGILMAITPETLNSKAVLDESVKSRVGDGNMIELTKMSDSGDIENFCIGSTKFCEVIPHPEPMYAICLDMIADHSLVLPIEYFSYIQAPFLVKEIWTLAHEMGYPQFQDSIVAPIYDDHRALYLNSNIPAIDIIDFDYPFWHTLEDIPKNCSEKTLKIVGNVVCEFIYRKDYENK